MPKWRPAMRDFRSAVAELQELRKGTSHQNTKVCKLNALKIMPKWRNW